MAYQHKGGERVVNTITKGIQLGPKTTTLDSGNYVVVWRDQPLGSSGQIFDADGNKVGAQFALKASQVGALPGGGFVAIWEDSQNVLAQIHDSAGAPVGPSFVVNTTMGNQYPESVAALASGEFVIIWNDGSTLGNSDVRGQRFGADGARLGPEFVVNSVDVGTGYQGGSEVKALAGGGFVVSWESEGYIKGQVFSPAGVKLGGEFQANTSTGNMSVAQLVALDSGGFAMIWTKDTQLTGPEPYRGIYVQVFSASGARVGAEHLIAPEGPEQYVSIDAASLATGGLVITWATRFGNVSDGSGTVIKAQVLDDLGNEVGAPLIVNTTTYADQIEPVVTGLPSGDFVISWTDESGSNGLQDGFDIRSQLFHQVASIDGTAENDFLRGTALNDIMFGFAGHDELRGGAGNDKLDGGAGNDIIRGQAGDDILIVSGIGSDMATGGAGSDTLVVDYSGSTTAISTEGPTPNEELGGYNGIYEDRSGRDLWYESIERFVITGGTGNDCLVTGDGDDIIDGAAGDDDMIGGGGDDLYFVDSARDSVVERAGEGMDEIRTGLGTYTLGANVENLVATSEAGNDFRGNCGDNRLTGAGGSDFLRMQDGGDDTAQGGGGNDNIYYGAALTAADVNDGGEGSRDAVILQGNYALTLGLQSLRNIEFLSLQSGSVTRFGDSGGARYDYALTTIDPNVAPGDQLIVNAQSLLAGEDLNFDGSAETDGSFLIYAGHGVDTLKGGSGNDIFFFEGDRWGSSDSVNGGGGRDSLVIAGMNGLNHIAFGANAMTGIESISVNNRFATDPSANPSYDLRFANGNVAAGATLIVNASSLGSGQYLWADGSAELDGSFSMFGGAGDDRLGGGAKNDVIMGGQGADTLRGGGGNDIFRYDSVTDSTAARPDNIQDFLGGDRIDLSRIDARSGTAANDAFTFIGTAAFHNVAGELRAVSAFGNVWSVQGDIDGDGAADLEILVISSDSQPIVGADFVL
jgi:Ca2+-binding RTX toxin-like protein